MDQNIPTSRECETAFKCQKNNIFYTDGTERKITAGGCVSWLFLSVTNQNERKTELRQGADLVWRIPFLLLLLRLIAFSLPFALTCYNRFNLGSPINQCWNSDLCSCFIKQPITVTALWTAPVICQRLPSAPRFPKLCRTPPRGRRRRVIPTHVIWLAWSWKTIRKWMQRSDRHMLPPLALINTADSRQCNSDQL